ncbi:MAG TPA: NAD(P)H-hydrate dehydratase [Usitatibacter sp.]|jgi:hydroxyethylthiazole kinase-like uncharacterized protein yjeF|nr:NAD(P)H-hydrate dehydratase [Usitatibacter sp.]
MRMPLLEPRELARVEERSRAAGRASLMLRAGRAVAEAARRMAADTGAPIVVVAGPGNNGGDAWVAGALLRETFHRVVVFDVKGSDPKAPEAREAKATFVRAGGQIAREWPQGAQPALVIDGLLGAGLTRDVDAGFATVIARINDSPCPVLAIDVPSGLDSATGRVRGAAVVAARTLTFIAGKPGLYTLDGPDHCGLVECDALGCEDLVAGVAQGQLIEAQDVAPWLPPRRRNTHKGTYGSVGIIGGNRGMVGAALLAGRAALLGGTGKVRLGLLSTDAPAADPGRPELMLGTVDEAMQMDVLVAGPGAGRSPSATSVSMFERTVMPALIASTRPLVLDADALNALAYNAALAHDASLRKPATILTPHPAEAARLLERSTAEVQADRVTAALDLARRFKAHVVLKGAGSICAFRDGGWSVNATGNPGLASAGNGDVLAGLVAALLAQGLEPARALQYAVCLHGAAGDACVARGLGPVGLTALEVAHEARALINAWTAVR